MALAVTSLLCAAARDFTLLLVAPVLQGSSAAMFMMSTRSLVASSYRPADRTNGLGSVQAAQALVRRFGGAFGVDFLVTVAPVLEYLRVDAIVRGLSSVEASDLESLLAGRPPAQTSLEVLSDAGVNWCRPMLARPLPWRRASPWSWGVSSPWSGPSWSGVCSPHHRRISIRSVISNQRWSERHRWGT